MRGDQLSSTINGTSLKTKKFFTNNVDGVLMAAAKSSDKINGAIENEAHQSIISEDAQLMNILKISKNVARSKATILIQGESGTGKELLANYIHCNSGCKGRYVAVNCAALPEQLAESELFGHEKGAFTGAVRKKIGKFELAHNGTIVLDEVTELNMSLQAKLLRVLQEKYIDRVGGDDSVSVDYRLIAISNMDLKQAVLEGKFREDLYYRINVIPLTIPPLRERQGDILILSNKYLEKFNNAYGKRIRGFSEQASVLMLESYWKGNVRELINTIERAVLLTTADVIEAEDLSILQPLVSKTTSSFWFPG